MKPLRNLLRPLIARLSIPVPVPLPSGHTCYVDIRSTIGQGLLVTGDFDPALGRWLSATLAGQTGIFVDAGANVGYFSLVALAAMRNGIAHAFDVDPRALRCLRRTQTRGSMTNLMIHACGLGAKSALAGIVAEEELGWTHIDFASASEATFPIQPLDSFAREFDGNKVLVIKIDVEGMELAVVQGATRILTEHRPLVVAEAITHNMLRYGGSAEKLDEFMKSLGYSSQALSGTNEPTLVFTPDNLPR